MGQPARSKNDFKNPYFNPSGPLDLFFLIIIIDSRGNREEGQEGQVLRKK